MSGNWTPGPWFRECRVIYAKMESGIQGQDWCNRITIQVDADRRVSADELEATNNLIVAAPGLAEAIDLMLEDTDGWDETQLMARYTNRKVNAILTARVARSKARGEK